MAEFWLSGHRQSNENLKSGVIVFGSDLVIAGYIKGERSGGELNLPAAQTGQKSH